MYMTKEAICMIKETHDDLAGQPAAMLVEKCTHWIALAWIGKTDIQHCTCFYYVRVRPATGSTTEALRACFGFGTSCGVCERDRER